MEDMFEITDGIIQAYTGSDPSPVIPEGIHTIGGGAFKGLGWLQAVTLPSTLKRIGAGAFKGCRKLRQIEFPEGLLEIGEYAFHRCHDLESLVLPSSLTRVDQCAFLYCDSLRSVVLEGVKHLSKGTFSHNLSLECISLNRELDDSNFADEVFEGCIHLRRIVLSGEVYETDNLIEAMDPGSGYPALIRSIAKSVFHSMSIENGELLSFQINLKEIRVPEGITAIGKSCFFDKKGIVSITFPSTLREIRANAFLNCISLRELHFQNEHVLLDEKAFRGCSSLKTVSVGDKTYTIREEEEAGENLEKSGVACDSAGKEFAERIREQVLSDFYISGNVLMRYFGKEERIRIPKEVQVIGERAFFGKEQLRTVICPEGLTEIREQAFSGCVTLQSIVLPKSLRRVEREAFAECRKLLSCEFSENLEFIGEYAFRRCRSLKYLFPENSAARIHPYAFYLTGLPEDPTIRRAQEASIDPRVRNDQKEKDLKIIASYEFSGREDLRCLKLTGVRTIGKYAFASCPNLEEVEIDAPECELEAKVFATCPKLKKVRMNVRKIGRGCFSYCRELAEVSVTGVSVLPAECFAGCHSLEAFEAKGIIEMEERCFDECLRLVSFDFSGVERIGERAFERCDSLKSVQLGRVECAYHAFADCAYLETVEFTEETKFGSGVFTGCTGIQAIVFDSVTYPFSRFSDGLNSVGNPYPLRVREVIASSCSCFEIRERCILLGYTQNASRVVIPEDITEIGQDVFRDHSRLAEIVIPKAVRKIGSHAFTMTAWLEKEKKKAELVFVNGILLDGSGAKGKVMLPPEALRAASWSFAGNPGITELVIGSERTTIEPLAFRNCLNLKKITDPKGDTYCLTEISDLKDGGYPETVQRIFSEAVNCFKLDEEGNLVESTGNLSVLTFPKGIRSIADGVYKDCHLLENIVLSETTERIGKCAFENSKWLKNVSGAGSVTEIGAQAFSGCRSLESIDLSDRLVRIGNRCFEHCSLLREIHLSEQLTQIGERTFFRCKSLTKIRIPASVKEIGPEAFAFCDALTEVLVSSETRIHERAFAYSDHVVIRTYDPQGLS